MQFLILNTDGTVTYDEPAGDQELDVLQALQDRVGGYIQRLPMRFHGCDIFLNEDGHSLNLDRNLLAEALFDWPDMLLGNAVVTGGPDEDLDTLGLSQQQLQHLHELLREHGVGVTTE